MNAIREKFINENSWGISTSIDLHLCNPASIRDSEKIRQYVIELCDRIGMKRFGECTIVNFGEDEKVAGFSMMQLIETSLISGHFANASNNAYIDIFSCKYYDPSDVAEFSCHAFEAKDYTMSFTYRK